MMKDILKYLNKENNFWTNQQVLGMREVFRGVVVKSWIPLLLESANLKKKT